MQTTSGFSPAFEAKWRPALDETARNFGLESLALRRNDLLPATTRDKTQLRLAIWVRGRRVGELVARASRALTPADSPIELQTLFAMREAIEADLGELAAVA